MTKMLYRFAKVWNQCSPTYSRYLSNAEVLIQILENQDKVLLGVAEEEKEIR